MANWKKFKKFIKKVAKPVALIASVVYPPLIPMIGSALGASGATAAVVGAAALGTGSSLVAGDSLKEALTTGALSGLTAGVVGAVSPGAFDSGLLSGGAAGATSAAAPAASTGAGLTAGSTGTGLTLGSGGATGLTAGGGSLGLTAGSAGASTIGGTLGAELAGISTGIGATGGAATAGGTGILDTIKNAGSSVIDFAKDNPNVTGAIIGAIGGAIDAANAPKEQTTTTSIDPDVKREYLANLERAKAAAANLGVRQFAQPGQMYTDAETALYNLGMTPFGAKDIEAFYNPYESQVIEGALGDIERSRLMQDIADRERASRAGAFGGSRQGVQAALTNEAALRQASSTASGLRQAGFNTAANLGLTARSTNMSGLTTSLGLGAQRDALRQAELDAARNIELERLGITSGALSLQPARTGETSTQPLYTSGVGSALSGGLTGAYIGSLLQPKPV